MYLVLFQPTSILSSLQPSLSLSAVSAEFPDEGATQQNPTDEGHNKFNRQDGAEGRTRDMLNGELGQRWNAVNLYGQ